MFGRYFAFSPLKASQFVTGSQVERDIWASVFSWATKSTVSGNSVLLPEWSKWGWVLMIVVTGVSVTLWTSSRISGP